MMEKKKFVFCSPVTPIYKIHRYRPYFEIPTSVTRLGFISYLIVGRLKFNYDGPVLITETGIDSNRHRDVPKTLASILQFLKKEQPDIFLFFHMNLILPFIVIASRIFLRNHKVKFAIKLDWGGDNFGELGKMMFLRNILLAFESLFVDRLIIENSCGFEALNAIPLLRKKKIIVLPNTYSEQFIMPTSYEIGPRFPVILSVSRISPEKGLDILVKAFASMSRKYTDWSVQIVGPIEDHSYVEKLKGMINDFNLGSRVSLLGPLYDEELRKLYLRASIFCLPSIEESFGIARVEAIAAGLPVVTSEAGCGLDFEEMGSLVFKVGDVEGLKNHLRRLISHNELRTEIAEKQQAHLLTYDQIAEDLVSSLL